MATPGELLSITNNRTSYGEMSSDERAVFDTMHARMTSALVNMPLLRRNNNCVSLAPIDRSYFVAGTNQYFVPLENVAHFDLSEAQFIEARRAGVQVSCEHDIKLLSMRAPPMRSAVAAGPLAKPLGVGIGSILSTWDLLVLIVIVVLVSWYYRSPRQLAALAEQVVARGKANWRP